MTSIFQPRVGVVLVNWRGWIDTLISLETLFAGEYSQFDVVVVDNDSGDDSIEQIVNWARGSKSAVLPELLSNQVRPRRSPAPIPINLLHEFDVHNAPAPTRLTIIKATRNGGFAAGNNLGVRYFLQQNSYRYFWLLNNDAYPAPTALQHLIDRAESDPSIGMVGSTLIYAGRPETVQALGGADYCKSNGRGLHIGAESPVSCLPDVDAADVERQMAYIVGASMLVSAAFLERVGLMEEGYFLYFEEIDWAVRGKPDFKLGYARDSLVYHKAGGSTQAASRRSVMSSYFIARNRMVFTRRFYPEYASSVWRSTVLDALRYAVKARWSEAKGFARAAVETIRQPKIG